LEKLSALKNRRNLLAFSAGVDSTAAFFLLNDADIEFDIAIVDYARRVDSHKESEYAQNLADKYDKTCFSKKINLDESNFEKNARNARYKFFEQIIDKHSYENLITAHQLNVRVEWFLMQFTKGAGVVELMGFEEFEKRENYNLIRPLINTPKKELLEYLKDKNIKYFEDESNQDIKYKRNLFRLNFSNKLVDEYKEGILKSFSYMDTDSKELFKLEILTHTKDLYILKNTNNDARDIRAIDKIIKRLGYIISKSERDEILRQREIVIAHKIAICITDEKIYISPYLDAVMDKQFKEKMRILKIPPKIRGYLYKNNITI
jgi:tRNA(Ile)-lysidine synthase